MGEFEKNLGISKSDNSKTEDNSNIFYRFIYIEHISNVRNNRLQKQEKYILVSLNIHKLSAENTISGFVFLI